MCSRNPPRGLGTSRSVSWFAPTFWGPQTRIRLSNALGTQTVTFADVYVGVQQGSSAVLKGTNRPVTVGGQRRVRVPPGQSIWSDPVDLPFVRPDSLPWLQGRRLAVSFHVPDPSGPMTWHAKALTTSYLNSTRHRIAGPSRRGIRLQLHHDIVVLSGRGGHDGARRTPAWWWALATRSPMAPPPH